MSFNFQGDKVILKSLSPKEVHEDQIKKKNKRENEKDKERKDKPGHNTLHCKNNHVDPCQPANCTSKVFFFLVFFIT